MPINPEIHQLLQQYPKRDTKWLQKHLMRQHPQLLKTLFQCPVDTQVTLPEWTEQLAKAPAFITQAVIEHLKPQWQTAFYQQYPQEPCWQSKKEATKHLIAECWLMEHQVPFKDLTGEQHG